MFFARKLGIDAWVRGKKREKIFLCISYLMKAMEIILIKKKTT
jgi:hypothetical protein